MADNLVKILDGSRGINNVDDPKSDAFQPPSRERPTAPFLRHADNLDATRSGDLQARQGRTLVRALSDGHSGWSCPAGAFYVDSGTLYRFDPRSASDIAIQSGINQYEEISYAEVAGQVFWCNGSEIGCISGVQARPWGLRVAGPPSLTATSGGLFPGRYFVAISPVSIDGIKGGARAISEIDLRAIGGGGIQCSATGIDRNAAALDVYLSDANGSDLFYHSTVSVGAFTIDSPAPTTELFSGLGAYPPPAGHIVRVWGGFVIVATDDGFYFSEPGNPHRFHLATDVQLTQSRPVMLEPMADGFFFALESGGTYFASGTDPRSLQVRQVDTRLVSEQRLSAARVPARKLPWLQIGVDLPVPYWATQDGFAFGLPGGEVRYPVDGVVAMDANKRASMAFVERPSGLRQILLAAREKRLSSRVGFGDQVSISVARGGVPIV